MAHACHKAIILCVCVCRGGGGGGHTAEQTGVCQMYTSLTVGGYCERSYAFSRRCRSGMLQVNASSTMPLVWLTVTPGATTGGWGESDAGAPEKPPPPGCWMLLLPVTRSFKDLTTSLQVGLNAHSASAAHGRVECNTYFVLLKPVRKHRQASFIHVSQTLCSSTPAERKQLCAVHT